MPLEPQAHPVGAHTALLHRGAGGDEEPIPLDDDAPHGAVLRVDADTIPGLEAPLPCLIVLGAAPEAFPVDGERSDRLAAAIAARAAAQLAVVTPRAANPFLAFLLLLPAFRRLSGCFSKGGTRFTASL